MRLSRWATCGSNAVHRRRTVGGARSGRRWPAAATAGVSVDRRALLVACGLVIADGLGDRAHRPRRQAGPRQCRPTRRCRGDAWGPDRADQARCRTGKKARAFRHRPLEPNPRGNREKEARSIRPDSAGEGIRQRFGSAICVSSPRRKTPLNWASVRRHRIILHCDDFCPGLSLDTPRSWP